MVTVLVLPEAKVGVEDEEVVAVVVVVAAVVAVVEAVTRPDK